jgi:hypothetical protein
MKNMLLYRSIGKYSVTKTISVAFENAMYTLCKVR